MQKVYDYILEGIKTKNYGVEIVTSAFVEDLKKLLHLKKSRHEPTPNSCLSREQLCHILGYLVCQMKAEDVSNFFGLSDRYRDICKKRCLGTS